MESRETMNDKMEVDQDSKSLEPGSEIAQKKDNQPNNQKEQEKAKQIIIKLFTQISKGCKKDLCFSKYCKNNPLQVKQLQFSSQKDILIEVLKIIKANPIEAESLVDSDSISWNSQTLSQVNETQLKDLLEDAYAFASSFKSMKHKEQDDVEMSSVIAGQILPIKLAQDQNPVKEFEIDFQALDKYLKMLTKSVSEGELIKNFESLVSLLNLQGSESLKTVDLALMQWRAYTMILQLDQMFDQNWQHLFEQIISEMASVLKQYPNQPIFSDFIRLTFTKEKLLSFVQKLQQNITLSIFMGVFGTHQQNAIKILDILNDANDKRDLKHRIDYKEFYNEVINKEVDLKTHFQVWVEVREKARISKQPVDRYKYFSFCFFPWILDAATKSDLLKVANKSQQRSQQDRNIMQLLFSQGDPMQQIYLLLKVHRENIIEDTLNQIKDSQVNLKKPLRIQFVGEPGVDEGGVKKEFFQILIRQLFDPNFGMFTINEKQTLYWFNGFSHEMPINFELIGILMGLAIYNNIILDCTFPLACYKKLLFQKPNFDDLKQWQPHVAQSLEYILNYDGEAPLEETLCQTFTIQMELYGEKQEFELKEGGSQIFVTKQNREEYIELYVDYIFSTHCQNQIKSFQRGFYRVCDEEFMTSHFKPEELEQLVCGSQKLDFFELEKVTRYVDGYSKDSQVIKWFWEIIHSFTLEQQKLFLTFSTGSDKAPIAGLGSIHFYIGRHGEDCERLPSAHTCFNHLLIPEYSSKEKLRQKLLLAISNSEGFGLY